MRELCLPGRVFTVQPPLDTHCFNGGLVEAWGKLLAVYRVNQRPCLLAISELGLGFKPMRTKLLWDLSDAMLIPEDPRVIFDAKLRELYVMFAGVHAIDLSQATVCAAGLDADYRVTWKSPCWYVAAQPCEKNWVPFIQEGQLYCIYQHRPLTILRFENGGFRLVYAREVAWPWRYGEISGGAPPCFHRGRWYCFFHSSRMEGKAKVYYCGCFTMDRDWNVLAVTTEPILAGSPRVVSRPLWTDRGISAVFPCGAVNSGGNWLLSYGYLDEELRIAAIADGEIDAALGLINEVAA